MENIDPYKVLELPKIFTLADLKKNYKRLVYKYHPDHTVNIATTPAFQLLTACYKTLLKEYEARQSDKQHHDLKSASTSYYREEKPFMNVDLTSVAKHGFNIDKFNTIFSKTKINDIYHEAGYKDWFSQSNLPKEKDRSLIKYKEPVAAVVGGADYYELGKNSATDWSGENINARSLHYTDCKTAFYSEKIVDPSVVKKRKEYKNVEELKNDRENISYKMTEKQLQALEKKKAKEEAVEKKRSEALAKYDKIAEQRHNLSNKLMLGLG